MIYNHTQTHINSDNAGTLLCFISILACKCQLEPGVFWYVDVICADLSLLQEPSINTSFSQAKMFACIKSHDVEEAMLIQKPLEETTRGKADSLTWGSA
jgi:hypothetical protein